MDSSNDSKWFFSQVHAEQGRVRAFIRSLGVRMDAVDDIAQEAFVIAWQKRDQFRSDSNFGAWVREIAKRIVLNEMRKASRRQRIIDDLLSAELAAAATSFETPGIELERQDRFALLRRCLQGVPEQGREMLRLRYFEDLRPGVIAGRLGCSSNQIRQTLFRLRRSLMDCVMGRETAREAET